MDRPAVDWIAGRTRAIRKADSLTLCTPVRREGLQQRLQLQHPWLLSAQDGLDNVGGEKGQSQDAAELVSPRRRTLVTFLHVGLRGEGSIPVPLPPARTYAKSLGWCRAISRTDSKRQKAYQFAASIGGNPDLIDQKQGRLLFRAQKDDPWCRLTALQRCRCAGHYL